LRRLKKNNEAATEGTETAEIFKILTIWISQNNVCHCGIGSSVMFRANSAERENLYYQS